MKDSHDGSVQAYTHPNQEEGPEQQSHDYSAKFQKGYQVFQLSSKLNEANIQIQKLNIKIQKEKRRNQALIESVYREKEEITINYEQLMGQFNKISTMLEAERSARKIGNSNYKKSQQEMGQIATMLNLKQANIEAIIDVISQLKDSQQRYEHKLLELNEQIENILRDRKQQERLAKDSKQRQLRKIREQFENKVLAFESELNQQKVQSKKAQYLAKCLKETTDAYKIVYDKAQQYKTVLSQRQKEIECLKTDNAIRQQQLKSLRLKQDKWALSRQKSKDEKLALDEKEQQLQFQVNFTLKRLAMLQQRYQEQLANKVRLERTVQTKDEQIRKRQKQYIEISQKCHQVVKSLHLYQRYKEKYDQLLIRLKQSEERANNFVNISQQYAQQIHNLQDNVSSAQQEKSKLQQNIQLLSKTIEMGQQKLKEANMMISNHILSLQQHAKEKKVLQAQNLQLIKKNACLQLQLQTKINSKHESCGQDLINHIRKEISAHYNKLLDDETHIRKSLQFQLYQAKMKIIELKGELSQRQKELAQVNQDRQLVRSQNQRLLQTQTQNSKYQEKRICEIKDRYKEMQRVKSQRYIVFKKLKIHFCFNFILNRESLKKSSQSSLKQDAVHK